LPSSSSCYVFLAFLQASACEQVAVEAPMTRWPKTSHARNLTIRKVAGRQKAPRFRTYFYRLIE
jgi:hypothetical protein